VADLARRTTVTPAAANPLLEAMGERPIAEPQRIADLARRPRVGLRDLVGAAGAMPDGVGPDAWLSVEIELRYEGYLAREQESAARLAEMASFHLPADLPYDELRCISTEARQKLSRIRPESLGQASRVPGVSPSDLQGIVMEVVRRRRASA
jgi:tRNA uridine 5-carboxymethylaminomethyl modification enzyme